MFTDKLLISDPVEFHGRTFLSHINQLPWSESLFTKRVEHDIIMGKHMTFCRVSNESMSIVSKTAHDFYKFYLKNIFGFSTALRNYTFS